MGNFGEALRDLRKRKRLSQDELGAAAGINGQTISNVETGKVEPRGDTFRAIAKGFGVTVEELEAELNTSAPPEPETIPPEVIAELFADAEQVGLSVPDYIRKARETLQRMKARI